MINIKGAAGLAKRAIIRKVNAITNCYSTAVGKASDLTMTNTKIPSQRPQYKDRTLGLSQ